MMLTLPLAGRQRFAAGRHASAIAVGLTLVLSLPAASYASAGSPAAPAAAPAPGRAAVVPTPSPGDFTGLGFDACTAPSSASMQAWLSSPYRAIGIYFGGINRGCTQAELTPAWVGEQTSEGWHLMPLYVGLQAPCTTSNKPYIISPAAASAQGRAQAEDAVTQASALGLARNSVLIFDMEAYQVGNSACTAAVLAFMSAWTARLHDFGYLSGFYSSMSSGVTDQVNAYNSPGYVRPDYLDFARWDGVVTVNDPAIPASYWSPHRRIKQYSGGHNETWGGVTINIDNDYLDVATLPATPFGDFTGDGWSDLVSRNTQTGELFVYPGNGTGWGSRIRIGRGGWTAMSAIVRPADFNRDGFEDIVAREASTGRLWLYPGTRAGLGARILIGTSWNSMREITPIADANGDGFQDLLAVQISTGQLWLYPGRGTGLSARVLVGRGGWNGMDELTGGGDFTGDGRPDLIARQSSTGDLYLYAGSATGFGSRMRIGTSWNSMRSLVQVGDFNRDRYPDLIAIRKSTNALYLYPGRPSGLSSRTQVGSSWGAMSPLA